MSDVELQITTAQVRFLFAVEKHGPCTRAFLCDLLNRKRDTLYNQIRDAVQRELVTTKPGTPDGSPGGIPDTLELTPVGIVTCEVLHKLVDLLEPRLPRGTSIADRLS